MRRVKPSFKYLFRKTSVAQIDDLASLACLQDSPMRNLMYHIDPRSPCQQVAKVPSIYINANVILGYNEGQETT